MMINMKELKKLEKQSKTKIYKIVMGRVPAEINDNVNLLIQNGWELYGNTFCDEHFIFQPMIKIIENTIDEPVNNS